MRSLIILCFLVGLSTVHGQTQYSFRRQVVIQDHNKTLVRESQFVIRDDGSLHEMRVIQTGKLRGVNGKYWKRFPNPSITSEPHMADAHGFTVLWTNEAGGWNEDRPWFAESELSGLFFPVSAVAIGPRKVSVRYFDWRIYRTSVRVMEVE